jgi:hypothetical protein
MSDFLNDSSPSIVRHFQDVIQSLPRGSASQFHSIPRLNGAHWLNCGDVVAYVLQHHQKLKAIYVKTVWIMIFLVSGHWAFQTSSEF